MIILMHAVHAVQIYIWESLMERVMVAFLYAAEFEWQNSS